MSNLIVGNRGQQFGGGIYCAGSIDPDEVPRIEYNVIAENGYTPSTIVTEHGGGVDCHGFKDKGPVINANVIYSNKASECGGGISLRSCTAATVTNNVLFCNLAAGDGGADGGGAISILGSTVTLVNNTIASNTAVNDGAGLLVRDVAYIGSSVTVRNMIMWDDVQTGTFAPIEIAVLEDEEASELTVLYCDVEGGEGGCTKGLGCTINWDDESNINENPDFADPDAEPVEDRDYTLAEESPCLDAGTDSGAPCLDRNHGLRPVGDGFDMGAYERGAEPGWTIPGDATLNCVVNLLDLLAIRDHLNNNVSTGDNWLYDVNEDGRINILDLIFIRNRINNHCP